MLELAKKCNATVLLCSSSSVYGTVNNRLILEDDYGSLNPVEVTACYSESKRACEMLLSAYHHQFGIVTYITRLRRIYGSTMDIKQKSYLNRVLKAAAYGGTLQTFRDPANKMQLTYITDAINGIVYVLAKGKINTPYNICSSDLVTVDEFTNTAYEIGKKHGMVLQYLEKADVNDEVRKNNRYRNNGMCLADRLESIGWRQMIDYKNGINRAIVALREK